MSAFAAITVEAGSLRLGDLQLPLRVEWSTAVADVALRGRSYRLRPWTFGERRRLLAAHLDRDGDLAVTGLAADATAALVEPMPAPADREVLGLAALAWSATAGARIPAPTPGVDPATQTVALAASAGWRPADIDTALAADVDRWFAAATSASAAATGHRSETATETGVFRTFRLED